MADEPERITSPYAPDLGEVGAFLERMIRGMRFIELVSAVPAYVTRTCEINGELSKTLADMRRSRPRSEVLARLQRQLPLFGASVAPAAKEAKPVAEVKNSRKGHHPRRDAAAAHSERVETPNPVPPEIRRRPLCGTAMKTARDPSQPGSNACADGGSRGLIRTAKRSSGQLS